MELGEWLARERESLEWSQHKLSEESGVTQSNISDIEAGKRNPANKTLQAVRAMVATLGISLIEAYLYAGLLDTEDERDQDAITVALLVRELSPQRRAELIDQLRQEER